MDDALTLLLDIGCGHSPHGTVNVDRFINATAHRSLDQRRVDDADLDVKNIPNFVCADACYLPFKDNVFDEAFSSHTLEHTDGEKMFREMVRVSSRKVQVVCPNQFGFKKKEKALHICVINKKWFVRAAQKHGVFVIQLIYSDFIYFPHRFLRLVSIPNEINFIGLKKTR